MELSQMRYALTLAECCSFTKAANQLFIAQPTLSQQITKLEHEAGFPIFDRTTRNVSLTPEGSIVLEEMRQIVAKYNHLIDIVKTIKPLHLGTIRFGMSLIDRKAIPNAILSFMETFPNIKLEIIEGWLPTLLDLLNGGDLDAALISCPLEYKEKDPGFLNLDCSAIATDYMVLAMHKNHRFASRSEISLEEMKDERFIFASEASTVKRQIFDAFSKIGISPMPFLYLGSTSTMIDFVLEGAGVAVISSTYAKKLEDRQSLSTVKIIPELHRTTFFVMSRTQHVSPIVLMLRDYMLLEF